MEVMMHNLISFNQLASWKKTEEELQKDNDSISEYFECLSECTDDSQICRRVCRYILST